MNNEILYVVENEIAWVTINRSEKMNRLTFEGMLKLVELVEKAGNDYEVKVIVITGAGDKAFCAGASLDQIEQDSILISRNKHGCLCPGLPRF